MPPELKKTITSINEMTCENCVFSNNKHEFECVQEICYQCHIEEEWCRVYGSSFCSRGQWLWFGPYLYEHGCEDSKLYMCDYQELYQLFAREANSR